jgi:formiminotetrahydrofolate cyclodeaminase
MTFKESSIRVFLDQVARVTPTLPAGGSAVALCGATAAALGQFVARLSAEKKKGSKKKRFETIAEKLEALRKRCLDLMEEDVRTYEALMKALRMPKIGKSDKVARESAVTEAKLAALEPPLAMAQCGLEILQLSIELIQHGYPVARADAEAAGELAHACLRGGVFIGRASIRDIPEEALVEGQPFLLEAFHIAGEKAYGTTCLTAGGLGR